jgi:hypothetical protein
MMRPKASVRKNVRQCIEPSEGGIDPMEGGVESSAGGAEFRAGGVEFSIGGADETLGGAEFRKSGMAEPASAGWMETPMASAMEKAAHAAIADSGNDVICSQHKARDGLHKVNRGGIASTGCLAKAKIRPYVSPIDFGAGRLGRFAFGRTFRFYPPNLD